MAPGVRAMCAAVVLVTTISVCISAGGCATTADSTGPRPDRELITLDDLSSRSQSFSNAYQIVENLRPHWLRKRHVRVPVNEQQDEMAGEIVVYLDGTRVGSVDALRSIAADAVLEIRHLDAAAATRLGTGHQHGAILVRTR